MNNSSHNGNGSHIGMSIGLLPQVSPDQRSPEQPQTKSAIEMQARLLNFVIEGDDEMFKVFKRMRCYAPGDNCILVRGETGTGKEPSARALHNLKFPEKKDGEPFFVVNCAGMNSGIIESELFGHVKNAFTGAYADRKGAFDQIVTGGTLFLDEVGDMPGDQQAKLLRTLEDKKFRPVGSNRDVSFNGRVICATNRNLEEMVDAGTFRSDLFQRISAAQIFLPRLEDRTAAHKQALIHYITAQQKTPFGQPCITDAAVTALLRMTFPGNVRGLRNHIERAALYAMEDHAEGVLWIDEQHVSGAVDAIHMPRKEVRSDIQQVLSGGEARHSMELCGGRIKIATVSTSEGEEIVFRAPLPLLPTEVMDNRDLNSDKIVKALEIAITAQLLRVYKGNQSKVAEAMDITRGKVRALKEILEMTELPQTSPQGRVE